MRLWPNVMVDIECAGTKSTAALMSVGAAAFDLSTFEIGPTFHMPIHLVTSVKLGMKIEPEAMMWWLRQSEEARLSVVNNTRTITDVLGDFRRYLKTYADPAVRMWSNSARFDLGILETAYALLGEEVPWQWALETDFRTVRTMNPAVMYDPVARISTHHNALDDALFQIEHLFRIKRYNDAHPRTL